MNDLLIAVRALAPVLAIGVVLLVVLIGVGKGWFAR